MNRFSMWTVAAVAGVVFPGCAEKEQVSSERVSGFVKPPQVTRSISELIGGKKFMSNSGQWIGADGDMGLRFEKGGEAGLTTFGIGIESYKGRWTSNPAKGEITATFDGCPVPWPKMRIREEEGKVFLDRADGVTEGIGKPGNWVFAEFQDGS